MNNAALIAKLVNAKEGLLCFMGFHVWQQDRPVSVYDGFPSPYDSAYRTPERTCERCARKERWLPGYGGSEFGCWLKAMESAGDG